MERNDRSVKWNDDNDPISLKSHARNHFARMGQKVLNSAGLMLADSGLSRRRKRGRAATGRPPRIPAITTCPVRKGASYA
jgi:hypothetical protein